MHLTVDQRVLQHATAEAIASLPGPASVPVESRDLQLVFRHDCL